MSESTPSTFPAATLTSSDVIPSAPKGLTDEMRMAVYTQQEASISNILAKMGQAGYEVKRVKTKDAEPDIRTELERFEDKIKEMQGILTRMGATYDVRHTMFNHMGQFYTLDQMADNIRMALRAGAHWNKDSARAAIATFAKREWKASVDATNERILKYDAAIGDTEVRKFVALMTGERDLELVSHLDIAAVQSFIWQIKRKLAGATENEHPLMLIFTGGQGFGKTWNLNRLFQPIEQWVAGSQRLRVLKDDFASSVFNDYYVVPFEDVHEERDVDLGKLKSIITEATFSYRPIHSRQVVRAANNSTMYATSNFSTKNLFHDDTGARRWWEIKAPNRRNDEGDRAMLASIDFLKLWHSVNSATSVNPRRQFIDEFAVVQREELKHESTFDSFFSEEIVVTHDLGDSYTQTELYDFVSQWYRNQGARAPLKKELKDLFKAKGIHVTTTNNRPVYYGVKINDIESDR